MTAKKLQTWICMGGSFDLHHQPLVACGRTAVEVSAAQCPEEGVYVRLFQLQKQSDSLSSPKRGSIGRHSPNHYSLTIKATSN